MSSQKSNGRRSYYEYILLYDRFSIIINDLKADIEQGTMNDDDDKGANANVEVPKAMSRALLWVFRVLIRGYYRVLQGRVIDRQKRGRVSTFNYESHSSDELIRGDKRNIVNACRNIISRYCDVLASPCNGLIYISIGLATSWQRSDHM